MKILITGASGFIGKNIFEKFKDRYKIYAPTSIELNLLEENKVLEYLKINHFDIIIHAATWNATRNSKKDTSKVLDYNLRMFFNIARASNYYGKLLYYGSGAEYDRLHWISRMKEDYFDTYVPRDDYGYSKYIMSKYASCFQNIYNLRIFGLFGKYEDWEIRFISNACCKVVNDLPITINQNVFFDYMHVDDLIRITDWFIENDAKERTYNVCSGLVIDLVSLARKIKTIAKKEVDIIIRKSGLGVEYSADNTKLLKEIQGFVFKNIDDGIAELYKWYSLNKKDINRELLRIDK
jgi:GDP-L-fucose synthase